MDLLLGYDIGSSSIKAAVLNAATGQVIASVQSPDSEMEINSPKPGWAEQHPMDWWKNVVLATEKLHRFCADEMRHVRAIGISYQMHGLVLIDSHLEVIRPAIIWCDGRAVEIGNRASTGLGEKICQKNFLNLPGNFTASKLRWVKENEPHNYSRIYKCMLPGDFIALKMTGEPFTTISGLSEGILWDYQRNRIADQILDYYEIDPDLIPSVLPNFSFQGRLTENSALELGLERDTPIAYRGGDQPNNAFSLNVMEPGEIATTAGTSGVIYGITDKQVHDKYSRVNLFAHVNHSLEKPRYGALLCLNGAGSLNSWLKKIIDDSGKTSYAAMDSVAQTVSAGSAGLMVFPYGNGPERTLKNCDPGASIHGIKFNVHTKAHLIRAVQEGVIFALNYGLEIMRFMGMEVTLCKAGYANMFKSDLFTQIFTSVTGAAVELYNTDGAAGAARGAGIGAGIYSDYKAAFDGLTPIRVVEPDRIQVEKYEEIYHCWKNLQKF